ncbi:hypothetical protein N0V87_006976 [Didymella glomerata]|uniref:Uncharacterized protein n=1 Tax=Didymella glomerata TaxID=749621 RepID=A0A9W9BZE8_9PLEO|nr:hypothetical protein N0V87_006976 [Didymella glomerata]
MNRETPVSETNAMEDLDALDVPDIDEASARFQQLVASQDTGVSPPIAAQSVLHVPGIEQPSITNLYDTILEDWIAPLPTETPVPSSVPPSSPLFPEPLKPSTGDLLSRLRKHLKVEDDPSRTQIVLPPSVSELLSHWQPGTDPSTYDWEATERAIRPDADDEETQKQREEERKKKERRERRQRREDERLRAKIQASSQSAFTQPAFPRSSPGPSFGGMAASSQVPVPTSSQIPSHVHSQGAAFGGFGGFGGMNSMVPQSQVEPGKFGGRPDKKKKKGKSRVSGF